MAELVGLAASIMQIAGLGVKLSTTLYNYVGSATRADQEITDFAGDVEITANALDSVGKVFEDEDAPSVVSKKAIEHANSLIKRCEAVFGEIHEVIDKRMKSSKDGKRSLSALGKLSWPMKEQKIELLRRRLESLKNSLILLFHVLQLANGQARGKLQKDVLEAEREKIRELHQRQQDSIKSLEALEAKFRKTSIDDDETLSGSTTVSRISTINLMAIPSLLIEKVGDKSDNQFTAKSAIDTSVITDDSEMSDSEDIGTDEETEHLTLDELSQCTRHVQKLLERISTLQQTFKTTQPARRLSKSRVHKLYRRFCQKFESQVSPLKIRVDPSLPLPATRHSLSSSRATQAQVVESEGSDSKISEDEVKDPYPSSSSVLWPPIASPRMSYQSRPSLRHAATTQVYDVGRRMSRTQILPDPQFLTPQTILERWHGREIQEYTNYTLPNQSGSRHMLPAEPISINQSALDPVSPTSSAVELTHDNNSHQKRSTSYWNIVIHDDNNTADATNRQVEEVDHPMAQQTGQREAQLQAGDEAKQIRFELGRAEGRAQERGESELAEREKRRAKEREEVRYPKQKESTRKVVDFFEAEIKPVGASRPPTRNPTTEWYHRRRRSNLCAEAQERDLSLAETETQMPRKRKREATEQDEREERAAILRLKPHRTRHLGLPAREAQEQRQPSNIHSRQAGIPPPAPDPPPFKRISSMPTPKIEPWRKPIDVSNTPQPGADVLEVCGAQETWGEDGDGDTVMSEKENKEAEKREPTPSPHSKDDKVEELPQHRYRGEPPVAVGNGGGQSSDPNTSTISSSRGLENDLHAIEEQDDAQNYYMENESYSNTLEEEEDDDLQEMEEVPDNHKDSKEVEHEHEDSEEEDVRRRIYERKKKRWSAGIFKPSYNKGIEGDSSYSDLKAIEHNLRHRSRTPFVSQDRTYHVTARIAAPQRTKSVKVEQALKIKSKPRPRSGEIVNYPLDDVDPTVRRLRRRVRGPVRVEQARDIVDVLLEEWTTMAAC